MSRLGQLYELQGLYSQAEPLFQQAIAIREKQQGAESPHVAGELKNLAGLYQSQNKLEQSEDLYKQSLVIYEQSVGYDREAYVKALKSYASLLRRRQRSGEAERLEERAKAVLKRLSLESQSQGKTAADVPLAPVAPVP
jgi:tetratricopeptide (TPR) repeat protein